MKINFKQDLTSKKIRQDFLEFFSDRGHRIVPSSPVVPYDDPTLLFTNAGMNQFKDVFLNTGTREYTRATNSQKCIRAGGKHNDLEEVGNDGFHHTFFEMLGNWSFGDYYKKEVIAWAWELLTEVWKLPKSKLWATVFETDDEAFNLWKSETDIDPSHILRFGETDNFWEMGDTGPCGPCSEIHFDLTASGCKPEDINSGREDVIEIWNLVFIQYNRRPDDELEPLPKKHVDTGMGFERIVRVLQNKSSNYETDIFEPLIKKIGEITGKSYNGNNISAFNAIADHTRALTFAISDGAIPSNEGRGYVLRRILRRAARLARKLEHLNPVIYMLVDTVVNQFVDVFPEISEKTGFIKQVIKSEEESFNLTLDRGLKLFNDVADSLIDTKIFPGDEAFRLYDTYGFPIDLTQVMATERGLTVDMARFEEEMDKQKKRARDARKNNVVQVSFDEKIVIPEVNYDPYQLNGGEITTEILDLPNPELKSICAIKVNPFFSESGGQISDTGKLVFPTGYEATVIDSKVNYIVLSADSDLSMFTGQNKVKAVVDLPRRRAIERNHSATHIVHESLRRVLGNHVKQLGSLVHDEYLRFDFPHFNKLEQSQINDIEEMVNEKISEDITVETMVDLPITEAKKIPGVKMFFGDKYGDTVRVVIIDESFSAEFCGGTHVRSTGEIGLFKIVKEESIAAGTRRIFARTGEGILQFINGKISEIELLLTELPEKYTSDFKPRLANFRNDLAGADFHDINLMKKLIEFKDETITSLHELREKYLEEKKRDEKELLKRESEKIRNEIDKALREYSPTGDIKVIAAVIGSNSPAAFKEAGEYLRQKLSSGVGLIAAVNDKKINLICAVSDDLISSKGLNAGKLISTVAKKLGGGGGGRDNLATAGAKDVDKLNDVLHEFVSEVSSIS